VPFNFFRRKASPTDAAEKPGAVALPQGVPFDALTDEWQLVGVMQIDRRLSDTLNRREAIPITSVSWRPVDGSAPFAPVPGLKAVDPYDLIVVLAGPESQPALDPSQQAAHKLHKVPYDVMLDCPPFRVIGTVHLFPGNEPERLLDRQAELFIPVTDAHTFLGEGRVGDATVDVALVNRSYLQGIEQIDRRTMEKVKPLPGRPLGGTSYRSQG
jgi:hypothetical protein